MHVSKGTSQSHGPLRIVQLCRPPTQTGGVSEFPLASDLVGAARVELDRHQGVPLPVRALQVRQREQLLKCDCGSVELGAGHKLSEQNLQSFSISTIFLWSALP